MFGFPDMSTGSQGQKNDHEVFSILVTQYSVFEYVLEMRTLPLKGTSRSRNSIRHRDIRTIIRELGQCHLIVMKKQLGLYCCVIFFTFCGCPELLAKIRKDRPRHYRNLRKNGPRTDVCHVYIDSPFFEIVHAYASFRCYLSD